MTLPERMLVITAPTVDGVDLLDDPTALVEKGEIPTDITILLGSNSDEGTEFISPVRNMTTTMRTNLSVVEMDDWLQVNFVQQVFKNSTTPIAQIHALYPVWNATADPNNTNASKVGPLYITAYDAAQHLLGDYWATCTQRRSAHHYWDQIVKANRSSGPDAGKVFHYYFTHKPSDRRKCAGWLAVPKNADQGACHSVELAFAYADYSIAHTPEETRLIYDMSHYFTNVLMTMDANKAPAGRNHTLEIPPLPGRPWPFANDEDGNPLPLFREATGPLAHWGAYTGAPHHTMVFAPTAKDHTNGNHDNSYNNSGYDNSTHRYSMSQTLPHPRNRQCDFWDQHPPSSGWK